MSRAQPEAVKNEPPHTGAGRPDAPRTTTSRYRTLAKYARTGIALATLACAAPPAHAQTAPASAEITDPRQAARDAHTLLQWTAGWNILVWPAASTLTGCFFASERSLRTALVRTAQFWSSAANIHFDFGTAPAYRDCSAAEPSDIRVGFELGLTSQSRAGTRSLEASLARPTLYLALGADAGAPTRSHAEIAESFLHELGHVLGLPHEHQHPLSPCPAEIKVQTLCQDTAGTRINAAEQARLVAMLRTQLIRRHDPDPQTQPAYDVASVMHYRFHAALLAGGASSKCHARPPKGLSNGDRQKMQRLYPADASAQLSFLRDQAQALARALATSGLDHTIAERIARRAEQQVARKFPDLAFRIDLDGMRFVTADAAINENSIVNQTANAALAQCAPAADPAR